MADESPTHPTTDASAPDAGPLQSPPPPTPAINPHQALDLLGDLETRLGQLRQWQTENDKHAESVLQQSQEMAQREAALTDQQQSLDADRQQLEDQRTDLDQQRSELDSQRAEISEQRRSLEASHQDLEDGQNQLEASRQQLDERATQLDEKIHEVDERSQQITERLVELDAREAELQQQHDQLEEQRAELETQQGEIQTQWSEIESTREELALAQRQAQELADTAAAERESLATDRSSYDEDRSAFDAERATFAEQRQALKDRKQELAKAQMDVKLRQDALQAQEESLERMRSELSDRATSASSSDTLMPGFIPDFNQTTDDEGPQNAAKRDVIAEELDRRQQQLEQDEARLAEKKQAFRDRVEQSKAALIAEREKVQDDERAVHELHEELESQQEEFSAQQAEFAAQQAELDERQEALEQRAADLERQRTDFDQQADSAETVMGITAQDVGVSADFDASELSERQDALAEREMDLEAERQRLTESLEQDRHALAEDRIALDARAADLDQLAIQLDSRERELDEREADLSARLEAGDDVPTALVLGDSEKDQRISELMEQVHELEDRYEQRKAQMMQADAVIKQRRDKVRGYLQQLREHSNKIQAAESKIESGSAQMAGLDKERRNLVEVKRFLEASEKAMVRKWALRSTVGLVALLILTLLGALAFSYAVGQKLSVPVWQASMALAFEGENVLDPAAPITSAADDPAAAAYLAQQPTPAEPGDATEPGSADAASSDWLTNFNQIVYSNPVLNETLNQMDQRGVRLFTNAAQLKQHFQQQLAVTGDAARTQLTYISEDPESVDRVLQSLGQAVAARQMSLDRAAGLHDRVRILQAAKRGNQPLADDSLKYAGISLGVICGSALILGLFVRLALGRSRRIMDEPESDALLSTLDKPSTWSPLPAATQE